jgi:hypothetical protein
MAGRPLICPSAGSAPFRFRILDLMLLVRGNEQTEHAFSGCLPICANLRFQLLPSLTPDARRPTPSAK